MVVTEAGGWGKRRAIDQRVQIFSYKMNKFWRPNVHDGECSQQQCIGCLKFAKRVELKCTYHRKMVTMPGDGYVNWLDCGDNFTMHLYIKTSCCTP